MPSITEIVSNIGKNPPLIPNRYKVFINGPISIPQDITLNCHTVSIPGHNIMSQEYYVHGPIKQVPYQEAFDDLTTMFYVRSDMNETELFHKWMEKIGGGSSLNIAYYNDIVGEMSIQILNKDDSKIKRIDVIECYPRSISEITFSYGAEQVAEITIMWTYYMFNIVS